MPRLEGKVAIISGGARGQGAVEARMFAEEGASVIIGDILDEQGRQTEAELQELGYNVTYVHLDVTDESNWQSAVQTAISTYGKLDILLNNAGILIRKNIEETTVEDWDRIFAVNSKGVFLGHQGRNPGDATERRRFHHQPFPPPPAWWAAPTGPPVTRPPRDPFASSPSPRQSSTPATASAATQFTPGPSKLT